MIRKTANHKLPMANGQRKLSVFSLQKVVTGFTVVELILYMGLLAVFLTVLTQIFTASLDTQLEAQTESSVQQDGRFILSRLQYDIERATSISDPPTAGSTSARLQMVVDGATSTYQVNGQNMQLTDAGGIYQVNSINTVVSNLQFQRRSVAGGKPVITVSFIVTSVARRSSGPESQSFQTTISTR